MDLFASMQIRTTPLLFHPLILLLTILTTGFLCLPLIRNILFQIRQQDNSLIVEKEVIKIQEEVETLRKNVETQQQSFYQEKIIRDELQMQKDGEKIIQLPTLPTPTPLPTTHPTPTTSVREQWNRVLF